MRADWKLSFTLCCRTFNREKQVTEGRNVSAAVSGIQEIEQFLHQHLRNKQKGRKCWKLSSSKLYIYVGKNPQTLENLQGRNYINSR